jgi:hypothetical protein
MDRGPKVLIPLPPPQRPDGMTRVRPSASLCRYATYSGPRLGLECSKRPTWSEYRDPMHNAVYGLSRILLPRTWVNKLPYHYADPFIDASSLRINMAV